MRRIFIVISLCVVFSTWAQDLPLNRSAINPSAYGSYRIVLDPKEHPVISAEINALVEKIYKRMGDSFEPGDTLITLDQRVVKAVCVKAIAKRDKAWLEFGGKKKLYDKDLISLFELKDAEAAYADALSDAISAEKYLEASEIKAAYKGKVVRVAVEEYELAQTGKPLIEIVREDILLGHFLAPASLLTCMKIGTVLKVAVNGLEKQTKISRISPIIDPTSGTIKVEAEINNEDGQLIPGLVGLATLVCD